MADDLVIEVSKARDAITQAKQSFEENESLEWVVVVGTDDLAGAFFAMRFGVLVVHRSGKGAWSMTMGVERIKAAICEGEHGKLELED